MPSEIQFKLYPRGFLGAMLEGRHERQVQFQEDVRGFNASRISVFGKQNDVDHGNSDIEALYMQSNRQQGAATTAFDFRKKVLIVALNAFGTNQFDVWYDAQFKSPLAGDLHHRFLEDTLRFIREGRREMGLETWDALLTNTDSGDHSDSLSEYANEFFGISSGGFNRYQQNGELTDVIQMWCSQPNGIDDLLGTLHLLFGNLVL